MVLEIIGVDDTDFVIRSEEFLQVATREHIYKMPFEIRVIYRVRVYHKQILKEVSNAEPLKVKVTLVNGHVLDMVIRKTENRGELMMLSLVHEDVFNLMENRLDNRDEVFGIILDDYMGYDANLWWHFREKLAIDGLVHRVQDTLEDFDSVHMTEWEGLDAIQLLSIFRISDVEMKEPITKYSAYNTETPYYSTELGDTTEIINFRYEKEDIEGLETRLIASKNVIMTHLNERIKLLSNVAIGDENYGVMGLQRAWKNGNVLVSVILGRYSGLS